MPGRKKGQGNTGYSLEERPRVNAKPRWRVRIWDDIYDPAQGSFTRKQVIVGTYDSKTEARQAGREELAKRDAGTRVQADKITLSELFDRWLTTVAQHKILPKTLEGYKYTINKYIKPELGSIPVQKLDVDHLDSFYDGLRKQHIGPRTVQLCHLRIAQVIKYALSRRIVEVAVTESVETPSATAQRGDPWSMAEAHRFLDAVDALAAREKPKLRASELRLIPLWVVALSTGMRRAEMLGLRWRDVNFDRNTVDVRQTVVVVGGRAHVQARAKTDPSRRTVWLTSDAVEALQAHRDRWLERRDSAKAWADGDLIFCTGAGEPVHPTNVDRSFQQLLDAADVRRIRFHDLRHTAATHMLLNGVPVAVVSRQLGHANPSITLRIYSHVIGGAQDEAAAVMSNLLRRDQTG